jgi:hypothetical protein
MWPFVKDFLYRGWQEALSNGSSTGISVLWLGFSVLALGFIFTVAIEWRTGGRNMAALTAALKSWKSWVGATLALLVGWVFLFGYSLLSVAYQDHQKLIAAAGKVCPITTRPTVIESQNATKGAKIQTKITQKGNNNTAIPITIPGTVKQGGNGDCQANAVGGPATVKDCGKQDPNKPFVTWLPDGHTYSTLGGRVDLDDAELPAFGKMIDAEKAGEWSLLLQLSEDEIKSHPEWLTPYAFSGLANWRLCKTSDAIERNDHFLEGANPNPQYKDTGLIGQANQNKTLYASGLHAPGCP